MTNQEMQAEIDRLRNQLSASKGTQKGYMTWTVTTPLIKTDQGKSLPLWSLSHVSGNTGRPYDPAGIKRPSGTLTGSETLAEVFKDLVERAASRNVTA